MLRLRALLVVLAASACTRETAGPSPSNSRATSAESAPIAAPDGMLWIPGGEFTMGSTDGLPDERPPHRVRVSGFFLDATEVTNAQFRAFVEATGYVTIAERPLDADELMRQAGPGAQRPSPEDLQPGALVLDQAQTNGWWWKWQPGASWRKPDGVNALAPEHDTLPVVQVAWDDARAYCEWAGKRLPTEAEWEYAARGGSEAARYGEIETVAWYEANSGAQAHPVGEKQPNAFGLYDTLGNVAEWVADWGGSTYEAEPVSRDPQGPSSGLGRSIRGGSWRVWPQYVRVSARNQVSPDFESSEIGFRCVRDSG